jgi:malate dehydrogenase (oxaloacetate-decarboxylating)
MLRHIGYDLGLFPSVNGIIVCDAQGIIHRDRDGLYKDKYKFIIADETNRGG